MATFRSTEIFDANLRVSGLNMLKHKLARLGRGPKI